MPSRLVTPIEWILAHGAETMAGMPLLSEKALKEHIFDEGVLCTCALNEWIRSYRWWHRVNTEHGHFDHLPAEVEGIDEDGAKWLIWDEPNSWMGVRPVTDNKTALRIKVKPAPSAGQRSGFG